MMGVRIAGTGHYLPGPPLDADALKAIARRHPDGLSERVCDRLLRETGIRTRHLAFDPADGTARETNTTMATAAGRRALEAAGWQPEDVELLIVTTVVPDHLMPPTSTLVQEALGITRCAELEISANCTAPYKGVATAASMLRLGQYRRALVCSANYVSFLGMPPWSNLDRVGAYQGQLRWILSDAAGALALEAADRDSDLRVWLESSGTGKAPGMTLGLGAAQPDLRGAFDRGEQHVTQNARYVLREAIPFAVDGLQRMLRALEIAPASIDHFLPSVSSMAIAERLRPIGRDIGLRDEAWRIDLPRVGNIGGVTFMVALDEMSRAGELRPGEIVCSFAEESSKWMCAGLVMRWNP